MRAVVNTAEMPTGDIVRHRDASLETPARLRRLERVVGADNLRSLDANRLSDALFGDTVFANVIMLGAAWQQGLVPVTSDGADARDRVERRCRRAEQAGFCRAVGSPPRIRDFAASILGQASKAETLDEIIARRADFLTAYQNAAYADRYRTARRPNSCCRRTCRAEFTGVDHRGRPVAVQADGLQGRIRSGAAAYGNRLSRNGCVRNSRATSPSTIIWRRRSCRPARMPAAGR